MEKQDGELKLKDKEYKKELANINIELEKKGHDVILLQTDIENYWKPQLAQLSKDKVLEEKEYLKIELGKKAEDIEAKDKRIVEVEKLIKIASSEKEDIISTVLKIFRDCKQYIPSMPDGCKQCVDASTLEQYGKNVLKSMTNLEGYLNTCKDHAS
jgi:hypothetical protein